MKTKLVRMMLVGMMAVSALGAPATALAKYAYTAVETDIQCGDKFDFTNHKYVLNTETGCCHKKTCQGIKKAEGKDDMKHYVYIDSCDDSRVGKKCGYCWR